MEAFGKGEQDPIGPAPTQHVQVWRLARLAGQLLVGAGLA